jgi:LysR family transcriptional activator of nhaA
MGNTPWINYHHLFYFKTIAEQGSVSGAAAKLRLGQPTLSAQLKQFEETLGVELFERRHKKLVLTEHGRLALEYARNIFSIGNEMYEALHDRLKPQKTSLHIGTIDSVAKQVTLQLLQKAQRIAPCHVMLSEGKPDELLRELAAHRLDLLLTNFLPPPQSGLKLYHRSIIKKNVAIFGSPKFKSLRANFPKSLEGQPMILPTYDSKLRADIDHWSRLNKVNYDVVVESQDIAIKKLAAIAGIGLIPSAGHGVTRQVLGGELLEIGTLKGVEDELFIVAAERRIQNPVAQTLFKDFVV